MKLKTRTENSGGEENGEKRKREKGKEESEKVKEKGRKEVSTAARVVGKAAVRAPNRSRLHE